MSARKQKLIDGRGWPRSVRSEWCKDSNYCGHTVWELRTKDGKEFKISQHWSLNLSKDGPVVNAAGFSLIGPKP